MSVKLGDGELAVIVLLMRSESESMARGSLIMS
jgi:hypothetical protein